MRVFYYLVFLFFLTAFGESRGMSGLEVDAHRFPKTDYSFSLDWEATPARGENKFILRSWHKDVGTLNGPYQDLPAELSTFLWMPGMGHGSVPTKMKKIGQGEYEISSVYFIMGGLWELHIQLKKDSQVVDEVILNYNL